MTALACGAGAGYDFAVPATAGTGRRNPFSKRRTAPDQAFFYARSHHINGGLCGAAERLAGVLLGRYSYPRIVRHHLCRKSSGGFQLKRKPLMNPLDPRIKPIQTVWHGYQFRSRLEARWAVFFEALGLKWEYEKEGFVLPSGRRYLPDFFIQGLGWFEIKPKLSNFDGCPYPDEGSLEEEFFKCDDDAWENSNVYQGQHGGVLFGTPGEIVCSDDSAYAGSPGYDSPYYFCECPSCRSIGFEYCGRSERVAHKDGCADADSHRIFNANSTRILAAANKARSARFEHGERPL